MKKSYIYISILLSIVFSSCSESWLNEDPTTNTETPKALKTVTDAQYALNGLYDLYREAQYYGSNYTYYGDVKGEDMQANGNSKRSARYYLFDETIESSPGLFWNRPYEAIRNANAVIVFTDSILREGIADAKIKAEVEDIKGQALTMRAMSHFDLVKIYGLPYTKNNGSTLGVPIQLKIQDYKSKPSRNTVAEVYDLVIIKDLKDALPLIADKRKLGKLNRFSTALLLARAHLYMGNDEEAYKIAEEEVIKKASKAKYTLWTNAEYAEMWETDSSPEVLWEIVVTEKEGGSKEGVPYLMARKGYDDIIVTTDFLDLIRANPDDIRNKLVKEEKVKQTDETFKTFYYCMKYPGQGTENYRYSNIPVLRLSEAYLIAAEAAVKKGDNTNATKYLKAIVERANPNATVTGTVTLDQVLTERRKEFFGEGHRFFDAMRNNQRIERNGSSHLNVLLPEAKSFDWNYKKIVLPIPRAEIDNNKNMDQNDY